jgi:hypothetical protein
MTTADAMHALRRRYEERVLVAKAAEARKCVAVAQQALAAGDVVRAANSFRIACGLLPGDPELERQARDSQAKADALLAETYSRQAAYEEKSNNWSAAARSWLRVCQARPNDAQAHRSAANAFMREGTDLRQAARLAQRMCEIEPTNAGARLILAEVYIVADLTHSARRELETATKLGAQERAVDALLKRLASRT